MTEVNNKTVDLKPILDERKCPAQAKICPATPACPEEAIRYVADPASRLGGRIDASLFTGVTKRL